ncbi:MAG: class I SAM-dependent methyltransferase [Candidatus Omnitrophica bacterium]|nr:class I SAM-dependent methyltransferase [Candidatus Omnitrophota bacterium]
MYRLNLRIAKNMILRIRSIGAKNFLMCILKKFIFKFLMLRYRFNSWHASAPYECRPYKSEVVSLADSLHAEVVVEIGCGLGEILTRVKSNHKIGFDIDGGVIKAACGLYGSNCEFFEASVSDLITIVSKVDSKCDLLICINWTHGIQWEELFNNLSSLQKALGIRYLLIDTINTGSVGFSYYHSVNQLSMLGEVIVTQPACDGVRNLHVVRMVE